MTARECRGGVQGLAGLPQIADEIPEEYFSSWGVPLKKCGIETPSRAPRKEPRSYSFVKNSTVSVCHGETARDAESLLKGQCTKSGAATYLGLWQRECRVD